MADSC